VPRLVIHVGPHKTGTTSVQSTLHANRQALLRQGVLYPSSLPRCQFETSHADVAFLIRDGKPQEFHA
jgi:hypothetical protein